MSEVVHGDLAAIELQALALATFRDAADDAVEQARRGADETTRRIVAELAERRAELRAAEAELSACEGRERADCSGARRRVERAEQQVRGATEALGIAERATARFDQQRARFDRQLHRLVGEGTAALRATGGDVERYLAGAASGGAGGGFGSGGGVGGASAGLPSGWAMVPLDQVDDGDDAVTSADEFGKGYSPEDLVWAHEALHEVVLPALAQGKGRDYFAERDRAEGRVGTRSYSDTHSGFFGDDAIRLEPAAGGYRVANGRHRIWVARRMGLGAVPARLP